MADKLKELEERMDKLENRLKVTFLEIEKRFEGLKQEQPVSVEDRLQELEDLLLLIQLEVTKLKDKTGADFGIGTTGPDIDERLNKLEEAVLGEHFTREMPEMPEMHVTMEAEAERRIQALEEKIERLPRQPVVEGEKEALSQQMDEIERRLDRLEKRKAVPEQVMITHKDVLDDVKKILYS